MCQSDNDLTELKAFNKYAAAHIINEDSTLEVSDSIWDGVLRYRHYNTFRSSSSETSVSLFD